MNYQPPQAPPPPPKKGFPTWAIVLLSIVGVFVVVGPIVGVLMVYSVRKYLANAKTAEARSALAQIGLDAATAYEKNHALCGSASSPVPASMKMVTGTKYQSAPAEWEVDGKRNAGFACLGFSMEMPQYFQYSYSVSRANPNEFTAVAHGDLNGDGQVSTFLLRGTVQGGALSIAPKIEETSPEE